MQRRPKVYNAWSMVPPFFGDDDVDDGYYHFQRSTHANIELHAEFEECAFSVSELIQKRRTSALQSGNDNGDSNGSRFMSVGHTIGHPTDIFVKTFLCCSRCAVYRTAVGQH